MHILKGLRKPKSICLDHWWNMVEHICDPKKIELTNVMWEGKKCVEKVSTSGEPKGEVRARLVYKCVSKSQIVVFIEILYIGVVRNDDHLSEIFAYDIHWYRHHN